MAGECKALGSRLRTIEGDLGPPVTLTTNSDSFQDFIEVPIPDGQVFNIQFKVVAREGDGSERASFVRTQLFYRQGGSVQADDPWETNETIKSDIAFDVDYVVGMDKVTFRVKSASVDATKWVGEVLVRSVD